MISAMFWTCLFLFVSIARADFGNGNDNGFGDGYEWAGSLDEALQSASRLNRPVMLIVHKSWCGACKNLKPRFAASREIQKLSVYFSMVNLMDDDEPSDAKYAPDGGYIPRIIFLSPDGTVLTENYNRLGSEQHKYFYNKLDHIVTAMKEALTHLEVKPVQKTTVNPEL